VFYCVFWSLFAAATAALVCCVNSALTVLLLMRDGSCYSSH
jgi:hypothetical protein